MEGGWPGLRCSASRKTATSGPGEAQRPGQNCQRSFRARAVRTPRELAEGGGAASRAGHLNPARRRPRAGPGAAAERRALDAVASAACARPLVAPPRHSVSATAAGRVVRVLGARARGWGGDRGQGAPGARSSSARMVTDAQGGAAGRGWPPGGARRGGWLRPERLGNPQGSGLSRPRCSSSGRAARSRAGAGTPRAALRSAVPPEAPHYRGPMWRLGRALLSWRGDVLMWHFYSFSAEAQ